MTTFVLTTLLVTITKLQNIFLFSYADFEANLEANRGVKILKIRNSFKGGPGRVFEDDTTKVCWACWRLDPWILVVDKRQELSEELIRSLAQLLLLRGGVGATGWVPQNGGK